MIKKETAQKNGVKTMGSTDTLSKTTLIEKLKTLLPNVINSDNQLNIEALKDVLDISKTTANNKGYELTFAGKGIAKAKADSETPYELKIEKNQSKDFDNTQNAVIRGDNLEVLKILKQNYHQKIKMIYIDPPYNTKSENFIYNDNFKTSEEELIKDFGLDEGTTNFLHNIYGTKSHSGWLSFMYPRLKLARELLREDGVIFISIDDNEQANLKIMCDEIFGEGNFVYGLSVVNNLNGNDNSSGMMETQESCLIYAKNNNNFQTGVLSLNDEENTKWTEDDLGFWKEGGSLKATGINAPRQARPKLFFPIYINKENLKFSLEETTEFSYELLPMTDGKEMSWYWSKEKFTNEKDEVIVKQTKNGYSLYKKQRPSLGDLPSKRGKTTFYKPSYSNSHGNKTIKDIFKVKVFDYSKSIDLIKDFIQLATTPNDLILDFFAGSGTTGDAVMQLNAEDGGNRKFILVQWDEAIKKNTEAHTFCKDNNLKPVISSITIKRLDCAGKKIKTALSEKNGLLGKSDIGYKVFSLTKKPKVSETENGLFQVDNKRESTKNTLINMFCATCKALETPIEKIEKDKVYRADNEIYVLGNPKKTDLTQYKDSKINIDSWGEIGLENWLNLGIDKENVSVIY